MLGTAAAPPLAAVVVVAAAIAQPPATAADTRTCVGISLLLTKAELMLKH